MEFKDIKKGGIYDYKTRTGDTFLLEALKLEKELWYFEVLNTTHELWRTAFPNDRNFIFEKKDTERLKRLKEIK